MTATTTTAIATRHQRDALGALVVGLVVLVVGMIVVRDGTVTAWEASIFHVVNNLPGALYRPLWPFQQLGALAIGPVVAIAAAIARRFRLAIAALVATAAKLVLERAVKVVASRQRPGTSIGRDVHLRGDVTASGESFVSGHAVLIAALAGVVTPYLRGRWKIVPWVVVVMVMVTRVYVGAHNPLDVVCGAGLGLAIAGAINLVSGARGAIR